MCSVPCTDGYSDVRIVAIDGRVHDACENARSNATPSAWMVLKPPGLLGGGAGGIAAQRIDDHEDHVRLAGGRRAGVPRDRSLAGAIGRDADAPGAGDQHGERQGRTGDAEGARRAARDQQRDQRGEHRQDDDRAVGHGAEARREGQALVEPALVDLIAGDREGQRQHAREAADLREGDVAGAPAAQELPGERGGGAAAGADGAVRDHAEEHEPVLVVGRRGPRDQRRLGHADQRAAEAAGEQASEEAAKLSNQCLHTVSVSYRAGFAAGRRIWLRPLDPEPLPFILLCCAGPPQPSCPPDARAALASCVTLPACAAPTLPVDAAPL